MSTPADHTTPTEAEGPIVSFDRQAASADGRVRCPLRGQVVPLETCLVCRLLIRRDRSDPPRFVVCYARVMSGWLGLDDL